MAVFLQEAGDADSRVVPDPKCKLNMSSFLTLAHFVDCLYFTSNTISIVLLLEMIGGMVRWLVIELYQDIVWETGRQEPYHTLL